MVRQNTWWRESVEEEEAVYLLVDRKQRVKKGPGSRYNLQGHAP
jgi:hypothetical protein